MLLGETHAQDARALLDSCAIGVDFTGASCLALSSRRALSADVGLPKPMGLLPSVKDDPPNPLLEHFTH